MENQENQVQKSYSLTVKETGRKTGKFHYQVIDELGNVISERHSNRVYVACQIHGTFYFGRVDLIGRGIHGQMLKSRQSNMNMTKAQFDKDYSGQGDYEKFISACKNDFNTWSKIAYLNN